MDGLENRRIVLGVTGSIAAYKAVEVVRGLLRRGADVRVVMSREAASFVGPMTFGAITGHPVGIEQFPPQGQTGEEHIDLAVWADAIAVVPATANLIGKMAQGLADDLLSTVLLACEAPCAVAPSMNFRMLRHPAVQANLQTLRARGCHVVESAYGPLANGEVGEGRLAEPEHVVQAIARLADPRRDLTGRSVLVTAGPTVEAIDPVRYITNRSSGKMGFAIAQIAAQRGAEVMLIAGPSHLPDPYGVSVERVHSAADMHHAVLRHTDRHDVVIMAAAVADYRPAHRADRKIKKTGTRMTLAMERTTDILTEVSKQRPPVLIGFAVETHDGLAYAREKRVKKNLDMVVYNDVTVEGAGFEVDTNIVTFLHADGREEALPLLPKTEVADRLLDCVTALLRAGRKAPS
ncbi:MAG: bifunctional phosphopantothenoylcysteine decarboxylase/phosphopantothenate--cysteine ligase CoaBC [candidate division Zixibacteria bacterium]|nr:bifunctional phosphopantothenoylcysteine decarboxylase/phosphopantothenate--cysteine ligase CoaBC [candidate division Zixibacteria bacterium]